MIFRCASSLSLEFGFQCRSQSCDVFIGSRKYIARNDNMSFLPSKGGRGSTLLLLESPLWSNSHTLFNPMSLFFFFCSRVTEKTVYASDFPTVTQMYIKSYPLDCRRKFTKKSSSIKQLQQVNCYTSCLLCIISLHLSTVVFDCFLFD